MAYSESEFSDLFREIEAEKSTNAEVRDTLKDLDLFVLDNSLRESTVGQIKGHTLSNKLGILDEVKKCRFEHIIVSAFSHVPRVDDDFVTELKEKKHDVNNFYAFTEIGEGEGLKEFPIGLKKMEESKLKNPIIEIDLAQSTDDDYAQKICNLLELRFQHIRKVLSPDAKIFVNLRDLPFAMIKYPCRVFKVVQFLGSMQEKPFGLMYEEPTGAFMPEEVSGWTKALRRLMDKCDWKGRLLAHIHKKWGLAEAIQLKCLASGADGIWASICEEGAALGHACSAVTIMNLIRLGNEKVQKKYNCTYLREAAIQVTKHTTDTAPHPKQIIYGKRALDLTFDFGGIAGGKSGFDLAKFFGVKAPKRITTLATPEMVRDRLVDLFGKNEQFTLDMAKKMLAQMHADLSKENRKEEYMSLVGLALLFDRSGGQQTEEMSEAIEKEEIVHPAHETLLEKIREIWDQWDLKETGEKKGDGNLEFYSFYNGFMAPYFGCYECEAARKGLQAIDMNEDNVVSWREFCVYLKWALREYDDIKTEKDLLDTAFLKGLIPSMHDECINKKTC